jgi:hypothetical protein
MGLAQFYSTGPSPPGQPAHRSFPSPCVALPRWLGRRPPPRCDAVDLHRHSPTDATVAGHMLHLIHRHPYPCLRVEEKSSFATRSPLPSRSAFLPCAAALLLLARHVEDRRASHRSSRSRGSGLTSASRALTSSYRPPSRPRKKSPKQSRHRPPRP